MLALAIPMVLLYEVGIWAAQIFIKHTQAPAENTSKRPEARRRFAYSRSTALQRFREGGRCATVTSRRAHSRRAAR